ncbi:RNA polymerase sigma factor [Pseudovibrio sp. POLY-S9]|uniref:RNA polymerase sigma factor n=1 Tax=Pseudovibrio sp. POLY-S9 TaxID=1576596 RepID=UPI001FCC5844|nr:RNA polymerase sigma factor [Pseudovibrio sp. POLY-S9]
MIDDFWLLSIEEHTTAGFYSMYFGKKYQKRFQSDLITIMPRLWRFALSLAGQKDLADDLVQATCLRALERENQFHAGSNFAAWTMTICRSIWLNEMRSQHLRKTGQLDTAIESSLIDPSPSPETNIFAAEVFKQVMRLPEGQRSVVELVFVEQFTYREAAAILGIPIGTIMSRLSAARKTLAPLKQEQANQMKKGELA